MMRLKIRTKKVKISLILPRFLVINRFSIWIGAFIAKKYISLTKEQRKIMRIGLHKCCQQHKNLLIVDIKTQTGEIIEMRL